MNDVSAGQGSKRDANENEVEKDKTPDRTYGEEGTNKTQPKPDPQAKSSDVPGTGKFIERSPFTR